MTKRLVSRSGRRLGAGIAMLAVVLGVTLAVLFASGGGEPANAEAQTASFADIVVQKVLIPSDDPGRFDLFVDDTLVFEGAGDGDEGGTFFPPQSSSVTISEQVSNSTPGVSLADYDTVIECSEGETSKPQTGVGPSLEIDLSEGFVYCTITNTRIVIDPRQPDCDGDGLTDAEEDQFGTEPCNPDTDGDGVSDWEELLINNTDPRDPFNTPPPPGGPPPLCPDVGIFSPPLGPDTRLTIFGGGPVGEVQDALIEFGYQSATFTLQNGGRVSLPASLSGDAFFVFFAALTDVPFDLTVVDMPLTDAQRQQLRDETMIGACTPLLVNRGPEIFSDGFESGDTSSWATTVP